MLFSEIYLYNVAGGSDAGGTSIGGVENRNEIGADMPGFHQRVQERLTAVHDIVHEEVPQAAERICMKMPTLDRHGTHVLTANGYRFDEKHAYFELGL